MGGTLLPCLLEFVGHITKQLHLLLDTLVRNWPAEHVSQNQSWVQTGYDRDLGLQDHPSIDRRFRIERHILPVFITRAF